MWFTEDSSLGYKADQGLLGMGLRNKQTKKQPTYHVF